MDRIIPARQKHLYYYHIDADGRWFCEGNPVEDRELFRMLSRSLFYREGRYFIRCEGEVHPVEVADAPLWVRYIHVRRSAEGKAEAIEIELTDGRREVLKPETLWLEGESAVYCRATRGRLKARFGKSAYYELASLLDWDEDEERYVLPLGERRFPLVQRSADREGP